ncbi:MAG: flagellar FlbD family protein [Chloroflexi bacterium]|nr:flagellar FlbD family protein [Chloroflexota bacterium]
MVHLSRLDGSELYVNAELIEVIEMTPDTVISLTNGKKLVVRESGEEVVARVVDYLRRVASGESPKEA